MSFCHLFMYEVSKENTDHYNLWIKAGFQKNNVGGVTETLTHLGSTFWKIVPDFKNVATLTDLDQKRKNGSQKTLHAGHAEKILPLSILLWFLIIWYVSFFINILSYLYFILNQFKSCYFYCNFITFFSCTRLEPWRLTGVCTWNISHCTTQSFT